MTRRTGTPEQIARMLYERWKENGTTRSRGGDTLVETMSALATVKHVALGLQSRWALADSLREITSPVVPLTAVHAARTALAARMHLTARLIWHRVLHEISTRFHPRWTSPVLDDTFSLTGQWRDRTFLGSVSLALGAYAEWLAGENTRLLLATDEEAVQASVEAEIAEIAVVRYLFRRAPWSASTIEQAWRTWQNQYGWEESL